jgi:hypothetical protein
MRVTGTPDGFFTPLEAQPANKTTAAPAPSAQKADLKLFFFMCLN